MNRFPAILNKTHLKKPRRAFTLIEILLVVAIMAVIGVVSSLVLFGAQKEADLTTAQAQIITIIREAQSRAVSQDQNVPWGVHFSNATSTAPFYALFYSSYAATTTTDEYRLPPDVAFATSTLSQGSSTDIVFSPIVGTTSGLTVIEIYIPAQPALNSTIVIEPNGEVNAGSSYVYIADTGNDRIQKFTSEGIWISAFSSGTTDDLDSITADASGIYVADASKNQILRFSSVGTFINSFSSTGTGGGQLETPYQIALDPNGDLFVVDHGNNRVEEFTGSGTYANLQFGGTGTGNGQFEGPSNMAIDEQGNIYVTDNPDNRVEKFNASGVYQFQFGICSSGACPTSAANGAVNNPSGVAVDTEGNVFISDTSNNRVEKFNASGVYQTKFGSTGTGEQQFVGPGNIAVDLDGNVYVSDLSQNRVEKFDNDGNYISQFGCISGACSSGSGDGQFSSPQGMMVGVY